MKTQLKYTALAMFVTVFSLWGCTEVFDDGDNEAYLKQEEQAATQDSMQMAFAQTLNEIDQNLDLIREKEGALVMGPESNAEAGLSTQEHIKRNISFINSLMEQNKEKLEKLTAQLKKSKANNALLTKLSNSAKDRIEKQEGEIAQLKTLIADQSFQLGQLNVKMNEVQLANAMLEDKAGKFEKEANKAYFVIGSYSELKKENVIVKKGGVLGIGSKKTLKEDFNKDYFTQVDIRDTKFIPVFAEKVKLVTFHPKNSFAMTKKDGKISYLEIKDPDEFWKASKVLVVEVQI